MRICVCSKEFKCGNMSVLGAKNDMSCPFQVAILTAGLLWVLTLRLRSESQEADGHDNASI